MPRSYVKKSDVRQIGRKSTLKRSHDMTSAEVCLGIALVELMRAGLGVYLKADKDLSQIKVKTYGLDDNCEGWFDLGEPVLEELSDLIEETVGPAEAQAYWNRAERRLAERPSEAPEKATPVSSPKKRSNASQNGSHEPTEA